MLIWLPLFALTQTNAPYNCQSFRHREHRGVVMIEAFPWRCIDRFV